MPVSMVTAASLAEALRAVPEKEEEEKAAAEPRQRAAIESFILFFFCLGNVRRKAKIQICVEDPHLSDVCSLLWVGTMNFAWPAASKGNVQEEFSCHPLTTYLTSSANYRCIFTCTTCISKNA